MKRRTLLAASVAALTMLGSSGIALAQTTLRIFTGGQQRPDVMRQIVDEYMKQNPAVKIEVEVGGATSEQQQQYLNTVLASRDASLDVVLIDVIRPAQWAAAQWAEPLDSYLGADKEKIMSQYLPAYREANTVNSKVISLPYFADAQFLYYRKDLLEKYGKQVPKTWAELEATAKEIQDGERTAGNADMWGFVFQGNAYEGLTCDALEWVKSNGGGQIVVAGTPAEVARARKSRTAPYLSRFLRGG